jgi:hypothetical protein
LSTTAPRGSLSSAEDVENVEDVASEDVEGSAVVCVHVQEPVVGTAQTGRIVIADLP